MEDLRGCKDHRTEEFGKCYAVIKVFLLILWRFHRKNLYLQSEQRNGGISIKINKTTLL